MKKLIIGALCLFFFGSAMECKKTDPTPLPVESVTIKAPVSFSATLTPGSTVQFTVDILPAKAANKRVTWSSSNINLATVNASGLVTIPAKATAGKVDITVTTQDGAKKATYSLTITVPPAFVPVASISNLPTAATVNVELTLSGTVTPTSATNKTITWSSAEADVTITGGNKFKATSAGAKKVTATVVNGASATTNYTQTFTIAVSAVSAPLAFTGPFSIPPATTGTAITNINVAGGVSGGTPPYSFSAAGLPAGLAISTAGVISGKPTAVTAAGNATVTVTDNASPTKASKSLTLSYGAITAPLTFTGAFTIPASTVGKAITAINVSGGASGGTTPYTFSATGLPAGLSISAAGVISGTPTAVAVAGSATVTVTDNASPKDTKSLTVPFGAVSAAPTYTVSVTSPATASGGAHTFATASVGYSTLTATSFTIRNTGTGAMSNLNVAISGTNAADFDLNVTGLNKTLAASTNTTFTLKPNDGLGAGAYTATITITNTGMTNYTFTVNFTVKHVLGGLVNVSGTPKFGVSLIAVTTSLTPSSSSERGALSYQWRRGTEDVAGATSYFYVPKAEDVGHQLSVRVTAANCTGSVTSPNTAEVVAFGGAGTAVNPYQIPSAANLALLAQLVNAGYATYQNACYKQTANINLGVSPYLDGNGWTPIGIFPQPFKGTYDGDGKEISGLTIRGNSLADGAGLFQELFSATVRNVRLTGVCITVTDCSAVGSIAGFAGGVTTIDHCSVSVTAISSDDDHDSVGGVVGSCGFSAKVMNCMVTGGGTISGGPAVGGIAGGCNGMIENCYTTVDVFGMSVIGGVVGRNWGTVQFCYATGAVYGTSTTEGGVGGIAGLSSGSSAKVQYCVAANSTVVRTSAGGDIGRVVGMNNSGGTLTNNYARSGMTITAGSSSVIFTPLHSNINGADITDIYLNGASSATWWALPGSVNFPASSWNFAVNAYPTLKGF